MKKVLGIVAIALFAFSFASCKKEYTCECDVLGVKTSTTAKFSKKADAEAWCDDGGAGLCSLK